MHAKKSIKRKSFALIRVIRGQTLFLSYSKVARVVPRHRAERPKKIFYGCNEAPDQGQRPRLQRPASRYVGLQPITDHPSPGLKGPARRGWPRRRRWAWPWRRSMPGRRRWCGGRGRCSCCRRCWRRSADRDHRVRVDLAVVNSSAHDDAVVTDTIGRGRRVCGQVPARTRRDQVSKSVSVCPVI